MSFVRAPNPIWFFNDLIGQPLNDEYYAFFLENVFPYLPSLVYRDPNGNTVWTGGIVQFQDNGALPNELYFDPDKVYRIEIRHGNTQDDDLIYEINNFVPPQGGGNVPTDILLSSDNQVTNPQFSFVSFNSPLIISVAGTYEIAPGWNLVLTGSGTATITQITNIIGNDNFINNPPTALQLNLNGWSAASLYQRFNHNGSLWASTPTQQGAVTMSATVLNNGGGSLPLTLSYVPSTGTAQIVANGIINTGTYGVVDGAITLDQSTNTDPSETAYVDMVVTLPPIGNISISNLQVIGENQPLPLPFDQETVERNEDHLFHYYSNSILFQPKSSILVGWNFALNPWQFTTTTITNVANNKYTADQTIVVQQNYVSSATGNNIAVGKASAADGFGFNATAVTSHNQFAIIQYIDPATIAPYWGEILSSLVKGFFTTTHSTVPPKIKMRLIYNASLPASTSQTVPISSWVEGSDPVFSAGWTQIKPLNDPAYSLNSNSSFSFNGFELPPASSSTMTLGIVLYTVGNMDESATADYIVFSDISLVPNEFAIESNPVTFNEEYLKCQYYYASTFPYGSLPRQNAGDGGALGYNSYGAGASNNSITWNFPTLMRESSITITTYNTNNNNAGWWNSTAGANSGGASVSQLSNKNVTVLNPQIPGDAAGNFINIHISADARLGR